MAMSGPDQITVHLLMDNDRVGIDQLTVIVQEWHNDIIICPRCGVKSEKQSNGATGDDQEFLCHECDSIFPAHDIEPIEIGRKRHTLVHTVDPYG